LILLVGLLLLAAAAPLSALVRICHSFHSIYCRPNRKLLDQTSVPVGCRMNQMRLLRRIVFLLFVVGSGRYTPSIEAAEIPMLHAENGAVFNAKGANVALRCVNLSPWLDPEPYLLDKGLSPLLRGPSELKRKLVELIGTATAQAFWQQWVGNFVTESDFQHLQEQGFNCVRLPINYKYILSSSQNGAVLFDESGIAPVDHAVAWGQRYGIYIILDLHHMPGGQNNLATVGDVPSDDKTARLWIGPTAAENQGLAVNIWRALAKRYAHASSVGGYDLINEPNLPPGASKEALSGLYSSMIVAIRGVDRSHMMILEGDGFDHDFSAFPSPQDKNIMYEFHEYAIFNRDWNTPHQQALEPFLQLRARTGIPLWLGEFGEETLQWQSQMVQLMKANEIGWAIWPWKRIDLNNNHPVIETIDPPEAWKRLTDYLVGAIFSRRPTPEETQQAMSEMLQAIRTSNCRENLALARILVSK
jgi:endoglucanase